MKVAATFMTLMARRGIRVHESCGNAFGRSWHVAVSSALEAHQPPEARAPLAGSHRPGHHIACRSGPTRLHISIHTPASAAGTHAKYRQEACAQVLAIPAHSEALDHDEDCT